MASPALSRASSMRLSPSASRTSSMKSTRSTGTKKSKKEKKVSQIPCVSVIVTHCHTLSHIVTHCHARTYNDCSIKVTLVANYSLCVPINTFHFL